MKQKLSKEELKTRLEELKEFYSFGFDPSRSQVEVLNALLGSQYKEVVLVAGRGWGKDLTLGMYLYKVCKNNPNTRVAFICPWYSQVTKFFNQVLRDVNMANGLHFIPQGHPLKPTFEIVGREVRFENGSVITGLSADNPDSMRGTRANIIVMNEVADIPEKVINTQVYAIIKKQEKEDKPPKIIFVGTPKGKNHLYKKFVEGMHYPKLATKKWHDVTKLNPDCISFHCTYQDNPKSSLDLNLNKKQMTVVQFEQEIMAQFMDDSEVFTNLHAALMNVDVGYDSVCNLWSFPPVKDKQEGNNHIPGHKYVAGWDIAKERDWSVLTIMDCHTGKVVYFERFQKMDYVNQAKKVLDICKEYNSATLLFDQTGVGVGVADIIYDQNKNPDQSVSGYIFKNETKADMMTKLVISVQTNKEWIPNIPVIQSELQALQVKRTPLGRPQYEAPSGMHDDCVMSLGLVNMLYLDEKIGDDTLNMTIL